MLRRVAKRLKLPHTTNKDGCDVSWAKTKSGRHDRHILIHCHQTRFAQDGTGKRDAALDGNKYVPLLHAHAREFALCMVREHTLGLFQIQRQRIHALHGDEGRVALRNIVMQRRVAARQF